MNLIERVKKIIIEPKNEWAVIDQEDTQVTELVMSYLLVLALIPAVAAFIGYGLIGVSVPFAGKMVSLSWGIKQAIVIYITFIGASFLSAFIIDSLAPSFGGIKDFRKAMQLVVYSYTPMLVVSIVNILPMLGFVSFLAGIYGLYVLYLGIGPLMKSPQDKITGYFVVSLLVIIVVYFVLAGILGAFLIGGSMASGLMMSH